MYRVAVGIFKEFDTDRNGTLDFEEFVRLLKVVC
jgi:Ca2+-binding EF-hand superfamily protein